MSRWSDKFRSKEELAIEKERNTLAALQINQKTMERTILAGAPGLDHGAVVALKEALISNLNDQAKGGRRILRLQEKLAMAGKK